MRRSSIPPHPAGPGGRRTRPRRRRGLAVAAPAQAATLTQVTGFGSNPGNLTMYAYRPDGLPAGAPAVVLLHGCTQNATTYFTNSGWQKYADQWKFALIVPQQTSANQALSCFNWYTEGDITRGQGEALSIKQMVDYAKTNYGTAGSRVYVSGLSAGGAMTSVMLATYPDVFAAGSVVAGIPYRCSPPAATSTCQYSGVDQTPAQWGDLVRAAYPGYSGPRPRVSIWHGTSDTHRGARERHRVPRPVDQRARRVADPDQHLVAARPAPAWRSTATTRSGSTGSPAWATARRSTRAPAPTSAAPPPRTSWTPSARRTGTRCSSA